MSFKGLTAIVTGGTRGIGKTIVHELAEKGCHVIATGTNAISHEPSKKEGISYHRLDLLDPNSLHDFIRTIQSLSRIDILINNAGINIIESLDKLNIESWHKVLQVNLTGAMQLCQAVARVRYHSDSQDPLKILNISSIWGIISKEKRHAYTAAKTGLIGLTRSLAIELAEHNILVNALCPGFTITELTSASLSGDEATELSSRIPLRRFAKTEEIANVALFLCSPSNSYLTGQAITVDGGFSIC